MYKFITPVSGTILSAMFMPGEKLNLFILAVLVLVALGIIAVNYKGHTKRLSGRKGSI